MENNPPPARDRQQEIEAGVVRHAGKTEIVRPASRPALRHHGHGSADEQFEPNSPIFRRFSVVHGGRVRAWWRRRKSSVWGALGRPGGRPVIVTGTLAWSWWPLEEQAGCLEVGQTHEHILSTMTVIAIPSPGGPEMLVPEQRPVTPPARARCWSRSRRRVNRPDVMQRWASIRRPGRDRIPGLGSPARSWRWDWA